MATHTIIHRLLYFCLIEIRSAAYESQTKKAFLLADLLHTIPLQLEQVIQGERTYEDLLSWIQQRASDLGCEEWINQIIRTEQQRQT